MEVKISRLGSIRVVLMGKLETMRKGEEGSKQKIEPESMVALDCWQQVPMCRIR